MTFRFNALLLALSLTACGGSTPPSGGSISVTLVAGDEQTAVVGHEVADPFVVQVTDGEGHGLSGQLVNFVVTSGGGQMFAGAATTDGSGHAQDYLTVGTSTSEPQEVEVRSVDPTTGEKKTYGTFHVTALSDGAVSALPYGVPVSAANAVVPRRMGVIAYDQYNNPASGATVTFTLLEGEGSSITGAEQVTGPDGIAAVGSWTFGPPGTQRLGMAMDPSINLANGELVGNAYVTAGRRLVIASGDGQTERVGQLLPNELVAQVVDEDDLPFFEIYYFDVLEPTGGGRWESGSDKGEGFASLARLGPTPGTNTYTVSVYGIGSVTFTATGE